MEDVLVPGSSVDMEFIEQNPEAIFGEKRNVYLNIIFVNC
jgi:hypothetical protein